MRGLSLSALLIGVLFLAACDGSKTNNGGVTVNNCMLHVAQHDMPFGGIGASGMGHYHGHEGFLEFSKLRPVFRNPRLSLLHLFYPPYTNMHRRVMELLIKYKR